jgi:hypothetical protein
MKKINLVLAFLLLYFTSFGQVEINTEWDNDGNLTFSCFVRDVIA